MPIKHVHSGVDSLVSESVIRNPAYVEVAPCPCDLTSDICDLNCCCDPVCTAFHYVLFVVCLHINYLICHLVPKCFLKTAPLCHGNMNRGTSQNIVLFLGAS